MILESSTLPETTNEELILESSTLPETANEESTLESSTLPETTNEELTLESSTPPETTNEEFTLESSTPPETTNAELTLESSTPPETTNEELTLESSTPPETTNAELTLESSTPPETTNEELTLESSTPPETTNEELTLESSTPPETTNEELTLESSTPPETTNEESALESSTPPETTNEELTLESSTLFETSTDMSNLCDLFDIVRKGDMIYGIYNTRAGQDTGGFNGTFSVPTEWPPEAIDKNVSTKYVNFGDSGGIGGVAGQVGNGTGFFAISSLASAVVARGIQFATGNDVPARDPMTLTLEGSNVRNMTELLLGSSWTLIYNGVSGISAAVDPGRMMNGSQETFFNTKAFLSYRLLITSQRGDDIAVQYSEARILGEYILLDVK